MGLSMLAKYDQKMTMENTLIISLKFIFEVDETSSYNKDIRFGWTS